ncbi:hypothetical protein M673_00775 [Aureimonas sp. AU20]|nr:hypothetical protein M673_00775 [Aureimonas sp. AU20]
MYRHLWLQSPPVKTWPEGSVPADNLLVTAMRKFCFV